eukprot:CAMPEP_0202963340 /NCGR_PEP_ID=MMETSP1396-20130829/7330_1 /ASSEMBLY_ACC=CAM_ASM_000872 /TAXON_ID= /ORGANISM="Pseudokeronopsis sp., Strain Brazil" /LENGTH=138 /DNA_ID=CAMNT_0049684467 /DNA_START=74 /DNA_END=490 /DNA_ORIENTATION=+
MEKGKEEVNNDRELIDAYMVKVRQAQGLLVQMHENNAKMKDIVVQIQQENSSEKQQEKTKELNAVMEKNQKMQKEVKVLLEVMVEEINESKRLYEAEPETRVKKFVHMTLSTKFRDVLRESQAIQTDFKNSMQQKIKR